MTGLPASFPTILRLEDPMTLDDIKAAVDAGQIVHWANTGYVVHKDRPGQYLITYLPNGSCIGLTDRESYARFWVTRPDQAARFAVPFAATPSLNVTPSMTKGNWFAPFRRRHVFPAA